MHAQTFYSFLDMKWFCSKKVLQVYNGQVCCWPPICSGESHDSLLMRMKTSRKKGSQHFSKETNSTGMNLTCNRSLCIYFHFIKNNIVHIKKNYHI